MIEDEDVCQIQIGNIIYNPLEDANKRIQAKRAKLGGRYLTQLEALEIIEDCWSNPESELAE